MKGDRMRKKISRGVYEKQLKINGIFIVKSIDNANYRPHPFMIGTKHVAHASENCNGMLGKETMMVIPCAMKNCHLSYEEHTSDKILFLQLTRNCSNEEATKELKALTANMQEDKIDGVAFIETKDNFRII